MKISIITVCYNSELYIETAIKSVLNQTYKNIEYLIVDGNSSDKTLEIIQKYSNRITKIISEPDCGIYDAMNKGINLATGDIIGILNSDDLYVDNNVITSVVEQFEKNNCESIFGDLYYVSQETTDNIIRYWETGEFKHGNFKKGWHPPHPTFFVSKNIYEKFGYFDIEFKLAADFELMLRFLEKHNVSCHYMHKPLIKMRLGGTTNKNFKNIIKQNIECFNAFKKNGITVSILYPFYRLIPKLIQFVKK